MRPGLPPLAILVLLCGCDRQEESATPPARVSSPVPVALPVSSSPSTPAPARTKTHAPHLTPGTDAQRDKAKRQEAQVMLASLGNAIDQYHSDYDYLPRPASATTGFDSDSDTSAEEGLIMILKGMDIAQNSRSTDYMGDIKEATDEKGKKLGGLVRFDGESSAVELVDPWGHYYKVRLDLDLDKKVENPMEAELTSGPKTLDTRAIIWSCGPDGDEATWEDNIISWTPQK